MAQEKKQTQEQEIPDFDAKVPSNNDIANYMAKYNKNEVLVAGTVINTKVGESKPKLDKEGNQVVQDGELQFWEPFRSVDIVFEGASMQINLDKENYSKITIGTRYLFGGRMGLQYGKVNAVFNSVMAV